jgi:cation:H+ antiporter
MSLLVFAAGLAFLILGAEMLVRGASGLAFSLGISPLVVGLTVVAFGTSAPELAVSLQSAWAGQPGMAVGNVVGSNIFNVLLILGISALILPLVVNDQLIRQEVPVMVGVSLLLPAVAWDSRISNLEGGILWGLLIAYTIFLIVQSRRNSRLIGQEFSEEMPEPASGWQSHWLAQIVMIVAGLALLVLGSRWLVEAAVAFARYLDVSEVVIGLTVIAAGTSLPEVATSVMAALRGHRDIAVGNVVGSNIFNILGVIGPAALIVPGGLAVAPSLIVFDIPVMVAVALACLPIFFTGNLIARWEGALFLALFAAYLAYLILAAKSHDALETYELVMGGAVLPLVILTVLVIAFREWRKRRTLQAGQ